MASRVPDGVTDKVPHWEHGAGLGKQGRGIPGGRGCGASGFGEITPKLTPEEAERKVQRESLQLSRKRVLHDIETSQNPRYRATLEAALKHLDDKIALLS